MNEEPNGVMFFTQLLRNTGGIFTLTVLAISFAGMIFARDDSNLREAYSLFALAPLGISYNTILQIAGGSIILALVATFLFSEHFFYKMRFLPRTIILLLMALIIFSLFAIIFKWFPANEPMTWLKFFISTLVCFFISIGLTFVKQKLEGKKYNNLLESYKARHNINP
jgi:cation transporter-like permease